MSARRACAVLKVPRSTYHHRSRRGGAQAELRQRIREIAGTRVRYGYRWIHVLLRREGWAVNAKRVWRL
ncbi:IS3 family transposase [Siccirubricoccus deserti]|uniref:IS3 family transposase n=1 Tax=Siccirubricoccus deserti TaxID=2013562 RepID=A0A9X0UGS2_9PROT|nr:IS3 family transposase [Siccirubricoccus deserti]